MRRQVTTYLMGRERGVTGKKKKTPGQIESRDKRQDKD